jgi:hypothetical protein
MREDWKSDGCKVSQNGSFLVTVLIQMECTAGRDLEIQEYM